MELRFVDPLAGKDAVVVIDQTLHDLNQLKQLACRELGIVVPSSSAEESQGFIDRVTLTSEGRRVEGVEGLEGVVDPVTLVCFVRPRLVKSNGDEEEEDEVRRLEREVDELFKLKRTVVSPRIRRLLLDTCKFPEWIIAPLTHVRPKHVVVFGTWLAGSRLAARYALGPPYLLGTLFYLIFANLSTAERREGEWSAYSLFNPDVRRLGGDNLDGNVRTGGWFGL